MPAVAKEFYDSSFMDEVVRACGASMKTKRGAFMLEGRHGDVAWTLRASPPTPGDGDYSEIRWLSPSYRLDTKAMIKAATAAMRQGVAPQPPAMVSVRCNATRLFEDFRRASDTDRWDFTDPAGLLDEPLRRAIMDWPDAWWTERDLRPALPQHIFVNDDGVQVHAGPWWNSAPAMVHLVRLGVNITGRLRAAV